MKIFILGSKFEIVHDAKYIQRYVTISA